MKNINKLSLDINKLYLVSKPLILPPYLFPLYSYQSLAP